MWGGANFWDGRFQVGAFRQLVRGEKGIAASSETMESGIGAGYTRTIRSSLRTVKHYFQVF